MYETGEELLRLQRLLDASAGMAGEHARSIFKPEHRLSALQVVTHFVGVRQLAAATVTSSGEPRVAPVDFIFFHGMFHISTDMRSFRARHLQRRPSLSVSYFREADPMIVAHGVASFIRRGDRDFNALDSEWWKRYGRSVTDLSQSVAFVRLEPRTMLAYAFHPGLFPEGARPQDT